VIERPIESESIKILLLIQSPFFPKKNLRTEVFNNSRGGLTLPLSASLNQFKGLYSP
jgi:hypothetical protein